MRAVWSGWWPQSSVPGSSWLLEKAMWWTARAGRQKTARALLRELDVERAARLGPSYRMRSEAAARGTRDVWVGWVWGARGNGGPHAATGLVLALR